MNVLKLVSYVALDKIPHLQGCLMVVKKNPKVIDDTVAAAA